MFDQNAVLDANDVRRNPVHRLAEARKSPVHDHKIFFGHNRSRFVLQRRRDALNELKEAVTSRFDMGAVLDVVGRPIALSRCIVSHIKQRVESFKYKRFSIPVSIGPGATMLTRTPEEAASRAADLVSPSTACLLAAYTDAPAAPLWP